MPLRERATRSGLQVTLKSHGTLLCCEFDRDQEAPRSIASGVNVLSGVMPDESLGCVGSQPNVMSSRVALAAQDVDKPPRESRHDDDQCRYFMLSAIEAELLFVSPPSRFGGTASANHGLPSRSLAGPVGEAEAG